MKRKIVGNTISKRNYSKSARGFTGTYFGNQFVKPEFVKISDEDAIAFADGNEWVGAVVDRIIADCTKIKPSIALKDKTVEMKPRHKRQIDKAKAFFDKPNNNEESFINIRKKFIWDLLVLNRGYIEKVKDDGNLYEIYNLPAQEMYSKTDRHGAFPENNAFEQKSGGNKSVKFDRDEIIFDVLRPRSGKLSGAKPLDILANAVATDILRAVYNSNYFINGGEASGILGLEGMSRKQLKRFRQYWKDNHVGAKKAHKMMAVNVPIKYSRMALSNRDMEFGEYGKELRNKVFAVFKMQPLIMGVVDGSTGKLNSEQQNDLYKTGALYPILAVEKHAYTNDILADGFDMNEFEVKFEGVNLKNAKTQTDIDNTNLSNGSITINEVRGTRGMPDVPWGHTPICTMPGGQQVDPDTGLLITPSDDDNSGSQDNGDDKDSEDKKLFVFAEDVVFAFGKLYGKYGTKKALDMVPQIIEINKYADTIKDEAYCEGIFRDMYERYIDEKCVDISELSSWLSKRISYFYVSRKKIRIKK